VLIELFSVGVTAEALRAKIDRKLAIKLQRGRFDPKFQVEGDVPHQSFVARMPNIGSKWTASLQRGPIDPKFQVEGVAPHQPFFCKN